jgi:hypothetical protein
MTEAVAVDEATGVVVQGKAWPRAGKIRFLACEGCWARSTLGTGVSCQVRPSLDRWELIGKKSRFIS